MQNLLDNHGGAFDSAGQVVSGFSEGIEALLMLPPAWLLIALFVALGLWRIGVRFALFTAVAFALILLTGFWEQTLVTLGLTFSATLISLLLGVPLGIWAARSDRVAAIIRPVLDFMQTMPAFVYLIPAAMLFGLGRVPGILATVIFAMPPAVRLTNLASARSTASWWRPARHSAATVANCCSRCSCPTRCRRSWPGSTRPS